MLFFFFWLINNSTFGSNIVCKQWPAWKAVQSEAVVTGGEALGKYMLYDCLEGSTSLNLRLYVYLLQGTAFQAAVSARLPEGFAPGYDRFA